MILKMSVGVERGIRQRHRWGDASVSIYSERKQKIRKGNPKESGILCKEHLTCPGDYFSVSQRLDLSLNTKTMRGLFDYVKGLLFPLLL